MYLHLGQDTVVRTQDLIGIFDLDNTTISKHTKDFLKQAQQEDRIVSVSYELPKSFIVCKEAGREMIYLSQLSSGTLQKRFDQQFVKNEL